MADDTRTEIGANTVVTGDIQAQEDVVVFGRVDGTVTSTTAVIIEESGEARARIHAANVLVAGVVVGNVQATERIEIAATGRVLGQRPAPPRSRLLAARPSGALSGQRQGLPHRFLSPPGTQIAGWRPTLGSPG